MTESSKVSRFTKEEFEAYQKMHHDRWDHNVMVPGVFKEFAAEIDAKIAENVADAKHEIAKKMKARNTSIKEIAEITGLSVDEVNAL